jgi:hypothetical protein
VSEPEKKPAKEMNDLNKYHAGEPFDADGIWRDMEEDTTDKLLDGIAEGFAARKAKEEAEAKAGEKPAK